jgi:hypothetical protein
VMAESVIRAMMAAARPREATCGKLMY